MPVNRATTVAAYCILAVAGAVSISLPESLPQMQASEPAEPTLQVTGMIRDFQRTHPDFNVTPSGGWGHSAGDVSMLLSGGRKPVFLGGGSMVADEWRNRDGFPIAPALYQTRATASRPDAFGLRVNGTIKLHKDAFIDAFDSNFGPYGVAGNYGADAVVITNATFDGAVDIDKKAYIRGDVVVGPGGTPGVVIDNDGVISGSQLVATEPAMMPAVSPPDFLQPRIDYLEVSDPTTLTGDTTPDDADDPPPFPAMHVGAMRIEDHAVLTVEGDLVILCDGDFEMKKGQIRLLPEASLAVYVGGDLTFDDQSLVNTDFGNTTEVTFNAMGPGDLEVTKKTHVYATITATDRTLFVHDEAHFYGGFLGAALEVEDKFSGVHVDRGNAMLGPVNFAIAVREKIEIEKAYIDGFDSTLGPYGGANVMLDPIMSTNEKGKDKVKIKKNSTVNADILVGPLGDPDKVIDVDNNADLNGTPGVLGTPVAIPLIAPPPTGASIGEVEIEGGTHVINSSFRCKKWKAEDHATIKIVGDVVIRCDDKFELKDHSTIELNPNSTLTIYVKKKFKVEKHSHLNLGGDPKNVHILRMSLGGKGKVEVKKQASLTAWVQGANTEMKIEDQADFYGSFTGKKIKIKDQSNLHIDMAYLTNCLDVWDSAGIEGGATDQAVDSPQSFNEWFTDTLGTNLSRPHTIDMTRDINGVYEYESVAFHPIDGELLGNEGQLHNHYFTYEIAGEFTYNDCSSQFVEFEGGDGAWVFIDDRLVMDMGGVGNDAMQYVNLDRLGLEGGRTYRFNLFYTQRQAATELFRLRTDLVILTDNFVPNTTAQFD